MVLQVFPIPYGMDFGQSKTSNSRSLKAPFGDGYGLRVGDGLNNVRDEWDAKWSNLTPTEATTADLFMRALGGYQAFLWAGQDGITKKWICETWIKTPNDAGGTTFSGKFLEVFDL